jgi:hypothetical protein
MLDHSFARGASTQAARRAFRALIEQLQAARAQPVMVAVPAAFTDADDESPVEWSEEDLVLLHWRLLREVCRLADPDAPLEEKFDTLRWVFTEQDKDALPFSFASCLRVVGCSPLSPLPFCGLVDTEELRDFIRRATRRWLPQTLLRYPAWVREAVVEHPAWVEARLARNPQWINEEVRRVALEGDLFA